MTKHIKKSNRQAIVNAPYRTAEVQNAVLVTRQYYAEIDAEMDALEKSTGRATVQDGIEAMRRKGNIAFFAEWNYLNPEVAHAPFGSNDLYHELSHIVSRSAHTPTQEHFGLPFSRGFKYGLDIRDLSPKKIEEIKKQIASTTIGYSNAALRYQATRTKPASSTVWAVNFAAGMYLREKIDRFKEMDMESEPYEAQRAFCDRYAHEDHVPPHNEQHNYLGEDLKHKPYALIKLSPDEWHAITAVALGLCEPEETQYCGRLTAVKEALQHIGLYYDKRAAIEARINRTPTEVGR